MLDYIYISKLPYVEINQPNALKLYISLFYFSHLHTGVLYSTPVCRFRHMFCDLSPTILMRKWLRRENNRSLRMYIVLPKHVGAIVRKNKIKIYNFIAFGWLIST
jgi:hypothetical protein